MRRIWKAIFPFMGDTLRIDLPLGAIPRRVGIQIVIVPIAETGPIFSRKAECPVLWYEFQADGQDEKRIKTEPRVFKIFGTGREIQGEGRLTYIDTYQIGGFAGHVFEDMGAGNG